MKKNETVGEKIVIATATTDQLMLMRALYQEQLGWGLSKMRRREVGTKLGAIEITLIERGELTPEERTKR